MNCHYCSSPLQPFAPSNIRCGRCGAVHHSDGTVISPKMIAVPTDGYWRASPWMLPHTRPLELGNYECRFSDTEPTLLVLQWDGARFTYQGQRVRMATFMTWRGQWAM